MDQYRVTREVPLPYAFDHNHQGDYEEVDSEQLPEPDSHWHIVNFPHYHAQMLSSLLNLLDMHIYWRFYFLPRIIELKQIKLAILAPAGYSKDLRYSHDASRNVEQHGKSLGNLHLGSTSTQEYSMSERLQVAKSQASGQTPPSGGGGGRNLHVNVPKASYFIDKAIWSSSRRIIEFGHFFRISLSSDEDIQMH